MKKILFYLTKIKILIHIISIYNFFRMFQNIQNNLFCKKLSTKFNRFMDFYNS